MADRIETVKDQEYRYRYGRTERQHWFWAFIWTLLIIGTLVSIAFVAVLELHGPVGLVVAAISVVLAGIFASGLGEAFEQWRRAR